jgi:hypothetical protein
MLSLLPEENSDGPTGDHNAHDISNDNARRGTRKAARHPLSVGFCGGDALHQLGAGVLQATELSDETHRVTNQSIK